MVTDREASGGDAIIRANPVNELRGLLPPEVVSRTRIDGLPVHLLILLQAAGDRVVLADGVVDWFELGHSVVVCRSDGVTLVKLRAALLFSGERAAETMDLLLPRASRRQGAWLVRSLASRQRQRICPRASRGCVQPYKAVAFRKNQELASVLWPLAIFFRGATGALRDTR